jgi:hypothetical protein
MKWTVAIVGPTGTMYKDTNAFRLLYPFPTREEAEAHAECLRIVGMKVTLLMSAKTDSGCSKSKAKRRTASYCARLLRSEGRCVAQLRE